MLDADLISVLVYYADRHHTEAVYPITNATFRASDAQIALFVELGCVGALGTNLASSDPRVVISALDGLNNVSHCESKRRSEWEET